MTPAEFETRLQGLLDDRRDPLGDPACASFLAEHPEHLETFARLVERCAAIPAVASPRFARRQRRRPLQWLLLGAAAAALALLALLAWPGSATPATAVPPGRVIAASVQWLPPMLQPVATVHARTVLLAEPRARLEVFTQWSAP